MKEKQFLITEDGSHTLYIPELKETYHSIHGAIQESNYVYLEMGLNFFVGKEHKKNIKIFEVGFGTGLNALLVAIYAESNHINVQYESLDAFPLLSSEIIKLNYTDLIKHLQVAELFHKIHESPWDKWMEISPRFLLQKVSNTLQDYEAQRQFDVCFYDAFAPSKQPEMWELAMLKKVWGLLGINGVFVTYCAKGQLKRNLKEIGFAVDSLPGPPGKFEMVRATKI